MNLNFRKLEHKIVGTVDGRPFNVVNSAFNLEVLEAYQEDANATPEGVLKWAKASRNQEVAGSNKYLIFRPTTGEYYLTFEGYRSAKPIPDILAGFIEESFDKGIDFLPILKAWARFLVNPRYTEEKAVWFAEYIGSMFTDEKEVKRLMDEEEFTEDAAVSLATYQDIAITQEGLLATYKVADMVTWKYEMVMNEETGYYEKKRNERYKPIPAVLDDTTGDVITPASFEKPDFVEDYLFTPSIWKNGDKFYSANKLGYVYKIGEIQYLPKDAKRNLDNTNGGGGLYSGGLGYINCYSNSKNYTLCCFVNPSDILSFQSEGRAFRTDALMPNNVWDTETPQKSIYHSSDYDKMSNERFNKIMVDAVHRDIDLAKEQRNINQAREEGLEMKEDEHSIEGTEGGHQMDNNE